MRKQDCYNRLDKRFLSKMEELKEQPKYPSPLGRPKGVPNRVTSLAREAIANFVDLNVERMQGWLDEVAADPRHGPITAFKMVMEVMEYHLPKLARAELTGKDGIPLAAPTIYIGGRPELDIIDDADLTQLSAERHAIPLFPQ